MTVHGRLSKRALLTWFGLTLCSFAGVDELTEGVAGPVVSLQEVRAAPSKGRESEDCHYEYEQYDGVPASEDRFDTGRFVVGVGRAVGVVVAARRQAGGVLPCDRVRCSDVVVFEVPFDRGPREVVWRLHCVLVRF